MSDDPNQNQQPQPPQPGETPAQQPPTPEQGPDPHPRGDVEGAIQQQHDNDPQPEQPPA